jgi:hypothetical protein
MGIGERIAAKREGSRRLLLVDEWGEDGKPLEVYVGVFTCKDLDRLQKKHKSLEHIEAQVDLIIQKAESKTGEKIFTLEDKPFLMREPALLIARIAGEVFGAVLSVEEQEKN